MMKKNFIVKASLFTLILALMVAGTVAIAAVMNKNNSKNEVVVNTQFRFTGATAEYDDITNESNWEVDDGTKSCNPGSTLPCLVAPNMSSITTPSELVSHLESLPTENDAENFVDTKTIEKRD